MNEITLLREYGPDAPAPEPSVLSAARSRLLTEIDGRAKPRQPVRRYAVGIAAAAAVTSGLLAIQLAGSDGHHGATAEAATILDHAAAATLHLPTARPGQYFYTSTTIGSATGVPCLPAEQDGNTPPFSIFISETRSEWVPPSGSVGRMRTAAGPSRFLSAADAATASRYCPDVLRAADARMDKAVDRIGPLPKPEAGTGPFQQHDAESLATWPRDPHKLVALLLDSHGAGRGAPAEALVNATDLYGDGLSTPADLRSAVLKAMALIPGIRVVDDDVTSDGRHGVGFAIVDTQRIRTEIVIDPSTGLLISRLQTDTKTGAVYLKVTEHYGIADSLHAVPAQQY